jgi:hypothetical protein
LPWKKGHSAGRRIFSAANWTSISGRDPYSVTFRAQISVVLRVDLKYLGSSEMWCMTRMEKISWTHRVRKKKYYTGSRGERNIVETIKRRKANWIGHILCKICLLKNVILGRIEVTRRGERRRGQQHQTVTYLQ